MSEVVKIEPLSVQGLASSTPLTPNAMLGQAVAQGADIDVLTRLMDLQERWESTQARKAFSKAIAQAKAEIPVIGKKQSVNYTSKKTNDVTQYDYESLADIAETVSPILAQNGLYYRWRTETGNGGVTVTCLIEHEDGHFEENSLYSSPDSSGGKNGIQSIGSAITYLQRYTLKAALGLAVGNDDDGRAVDVDFISSEQAEEIKDLLYKTGANVQKFLGHFNINNVDEMPSEMHSNAVALLKKKVASNANT